MTKVHRFLLTGIYLIGSVYSAHGSEWSGNIAIEERAFFHSAEDSRQHDNYLSLSAQPEFYNDWDNGRQSITFVPFIRLDQHDENRTHFDIRELTWLKAANDWEIRIGVRKLFWGVTESQHLVDIINQTDAVESIDGEEKLGQPMLNYAMITDGGTLDLFALIGFRERTFAGEQGRLRPGLVVDEEKTRYESSQQQRHIDYAIRWSHSIGNWDVGVSHFYGTSRDPTLDRSLNEKFKPILIPHYPIINQTGIDVQTIVENWLWKVEAISRTGQGDRYAAFTGGFEYSFYGLFDTKTDLGIISEYLFDERENNVETLFGNDLMIGGRFTLNDEQSTDFLIGIILDLDDKARLLSLESSRRIGDTWKLTLEARLFSNIDRSSILLYDLRNDDFIQAEIAWYF